MTGEKQAATGRGSRISKLNFEELLPKPFHRTDMPRRCCFCCRQEAQTQKAATSQNHPKSSSIKKLSNYKVSRKSRKPTPCLGHEESQHNGNFYYFFPPT